MPPRKNYRPSAITFLLLFSLTWNHLEATKVDTQRRCKVPETTSLRHYGSGRVLTEFYDLLSSCPNISSLELGFGEHGCVAEVHPWLFEFQPGDTFVPLKSLTLTRYDFEGRRTYLCNRLRWRPSAFVRKIEAWWRYYSGYLRYEVFSENDDLNQWPTCEAVEPNIDRWLRAMDFTQLERLHLFGRESGYFWKRMKGELPGLRDFSTELQSFHGPALDFISQLPPLESLSLHQTWSISGESEKLDCNAYPLDKLLQRHGPALKKLTISQAESNVPGSRRVVCAPSQVTKIYDACPFLEHLGLDVDRNGEWPNATFNALVNNTKISSLQLRFEVGANLNQYFIDLAGYLTSPNKSAISEGEYRFPVIDNSTAEALFRDLRAKKRGNALQRLDIQLGDAEEFLEYAGLDNQMSWAEIRHRSWTFIAAEDGSIECTKYTGRIAGY